MDTLYKAGSLVCFQFLSVAKMLLLLPRLLLNAASQQQRQGHAGCRFYEGSVVHIRRRPVENKFEYSVCMALIDLQNPPDWFRQQQADHMSAETARQFAGTDGNVLLLTNPVVAGYIQNPISIYYCYDAAGKLMRGISEVTNTPWAERVTFVFNPSGDKTPKALHVSPFMDMQNTWHLQATEPGQGRPLKVSVLVSHPTYGRYFDAVLLLKERPADQQSPAEYAGLSSLLKYGFMPQRVAFWIYWQAVKLIVKGCPIYAKPSSAYRQRVSADSTLQPGGCGAPYVWRDAQQWPWYL